MASRITFLSSTVTSLFRPHLKAGLSHKLPICTSHAFKPQVPLTFQIRNTSFFNKHSADQLWKGVTSVSNAGKRRGRGRTAPRKRDLNRGQRIGEGKINIAFPGLNAPILQGRELVQQRRLPDNLEREERLLKIRNTMNKKMSKKLHPLERGWSGIKPGGRTIGPPDPVGEATFDGFQSWVVGYKTVSIMTGTIGRKKCTRTLVLTGNGNGLAAFASAKSVEGPIALRKAKNRAGQRLFYVKRYEDRTVFHDFCGQFGHTKVFVKQMYEGYGLICHRAIKLCCQAVGIKDIYAKIEGSTNVRNVVKAFFHGLLQQKSHQEIADDKKLHLVEFRAEHDNFPRVVASPVNARKAEEIDPNENLLFSLYCMNGKVPLYKKRPPPFYEQYISYNIYKRKQERIRNHDKVRIRLLAEYGEVRSFLADKYPEAALSYGAKKTPEDE